MNFGLIVLVAFSLVLFGVLIGCRLSGRWLDVRSKRQAEMQRALNRQWQELRMQNEKVVYPDERSGSRGRGRVQRCSD